MEHIHSSTQSITDRMYTQPTYVIDFIDVVTIDSWWLSAEHQRPCWKLYWNKDSGSSIRFLEEEYVLDGEHGCIITPNTPYIPHVDQPTEHLYIHFRILEPDLSLPFFVSHITPSILFGGKSFDQVTEMVHRPVTTMAHRVGIYSALYQATMPVLEHIQDKEEDILFPILSYIELHIQADVRNQTLAELAGLSVDTLRRKFLEKTNRTPQEYILRLRISKAAQMLQHTQYPIDLIAEETGFYDRSHFSKEFKKKVGTSPAAYRRDFYQSGKNDLS